MLRKPSRPMLRQLCNLPAPAKLNLFLHVVGRASDGYHQIETVFELLTHGDRIDLRMRDDACIRLLDPIPGVPDEQNLCVRAAALLAQTSGVSVGVDIGLRKRLPMAAGLGGGSSDAATTLLGLNRLWRLDYTRAQLAQIGLKLGADVPFFVFGQSALAGGIGEQLHALALPSRYYVVVEPGVAVATALAFSAPELTRNRKHLKIDGFSGVASGSHQSLEKGARKKVSGRFSAAADRVDIRAPNLARAIEDGINDLQPVVLARFPAVEKALRLLQNAANDEQAAAGRARMTGSGSCLFLPLTNQSQALRIAAKVVSGLRAAGLAGTAWVSQSLPSHPLNELAPQR
jgi:4-diphosphocytidyl-2-C-methyl-D-erythritol kinase